MLRVTILLTFLALGEIPTLSAQTKDFPDDSSRTCIVPFFNFGGKLLLQATVDDQQGYFIFDTGAPALILNRKYFEGKAFSGQYQPTAFGLNGEVKQVWTKEVKLELGARTWKKVYATLYNLEYLEESKGIVILGLIGSLLFRNSELEVDFKNKRLVIYSLNELEEKTDDFVRRSLPDVTIPFRQKGHMPCIKAYVKGLPLQLGIDSGAGIALIMNEKHAELSPFADQEDLIRIRGLGQNTLQTYSYQLQSLSVSNLLYNRIRIAFVDLGRVNDQLAGPDLDGILGLDVLSRHRMAFNFRKKEIYIWIPPTENDQLVLLDPAKND
jgi:hypothetical protein